MKSKYYFEPEDFKGGGQMIVRQSAPLGCKDISFMASVSYKVGWITPISKGKDRAVMVSLTDGMCCVFPNIEALCKALNSDTHGYRPMSTDPNTIEYWGYHDDVVGQFLQSNASSADAIVALCQQNATMEGGK